MRGVVCFLPNIVMESNEKWGQRWGHLEHQTHHEDHGHTSHNVGMILNDELMAQYGWILGASFFQRHIVKISRTFWGLVRSLNIFEKKSLFKKRPWAPLASCLRVDVTSNLFHSVQLELPTRHSPNLDTVNKKSDRIELQNLRQIRNLKEPVLIS